MASTKKSTAKKSAAKKNSPQNKKEENLEEVKKVEEAKETKGMPTAIIMKTVKGKGVSYMENNAGWHGKAPNDEEYAIAMADLEKVGEALCQK